MSRWKLFFRVMLCCWLAVAFSMVACGGDDGDDGGNGVPGSHHVRVVFVTEGEYNGNLGQIDGADNKCQLEADAAGLDGEFKAWISTAYAGGTDPVDRFNHSTAPYQLVDGTQIAADWADLTDGTLDHAIDMNARGVREYFWSCWTSTNASGQGIGGGTGNTCQDWTSSSADDFAGEGLISHGDEWWSWITYSYVSCNDTSHLYCFEQ